MTDTDDRKQIGMRLPVELVERIDVEAEARHVSRRKLTELLLRDGLDRLRPPASLLAARTVTRRLLDGWMIDGQAPDEYPELWVSERTPTQYEHITDAERAWLASISPPGSGDDS